MRSLTLRRLTFALIAAPLALGLAACGSEKAEDAATSGAPLAKVAAPAGKVWSDVVVTTPEGGYRMGNPDAPIKLIEFGSLTCSHCAEFSEKGSAQLRDNFVASGRVSFEFRNFIRDAIDVTAAQLTRCGAPESFFALTEQAFANQPDMLAKAQAAGEKLQAATELPENTRGIAIAQSVGLIDFFAARGIAKDQAAACLANSASATQLAKRTADQAKEFEITATPTFLINAQKADVGNWDEVKARLESLGAR